VHTLTGDLGAGQAVNSPAGHQDASTHPGLATGAATSTDGANNNNNNTNDDNNDEDDDDARAADRFRSRLDSVLGLEGIVTITITIGERRRW
jgi:hypothetical protein